MNVISRKAASASGLKHYFTGKPCSKGHIDKRYVVSCRCMTCAREQAVDAFRSLDSEKRKALRERNRRLWQTAEYRTRALRYQRERNQDKKRAANREWKKAHRASCTDRQNARFARLRAVLVESVSLEYLFERDKGRCQLCGRKLNMRTKWPHPKAPTRDHIIPLSKGGTHERKNLQLACRSCNVSKGNRARGEQLLLVG